ncbi:hypothetical protein AgCh_027077 [Apium graveolens]
MKGLAREMVGEAMNGGRGLDSKYSSSRNVREGSRDRYRERNRSRSRSPSRHSRRSANDICKESNRQTINAEDVFKALDDIEFSEFVGPLRASLEGKELEKGSQSNNATQTLSTRSKFDGYFDDDCDDDDTPGQGSSENSPQPINSESAADNLEFDPEVA